MYRLVCVGGSGLWTYLSLVLRKKAAVDSRDRNRSDAVELPESVIIIDQAKEDRNKALEAVRKVYAGANFKEPKTSVYQLRIPNDKNGASATRLLFTEDCDDTTKSRLEYIRELDLDISNGFFGKPRLTATWATLYGFERVNGDPIQWLDDKNELARFRTGAAAPGKEAHMVLVGSVTGGTGAGLLPILARGLLGLDAGKDAAWAYAAHVIALGGWFNADAVNQEGVNAINANRLQQNSAQGYRALHNLLELYNNRVTQNQPPGNVVQTTLSLLASPPNLRQLQAPLSWQDDDAARIVETHAVPAFFDVVVDAILSRVGPSSIEQAADHKARIAFGQRDGFEFPPSAKGKAAKSALLSPETASMIVAAHRAELLSDECRFPLLAATRFGSLPIQRPQGFGKLFRDFIGASSLGGCRRSRMFIESMQTNLAAKATKVFDDCGRIPDGLLLSQALIINTIIDDLDKEYAPSKMRDELVAMVDTGARQARLDETDIRTKGERFAEWLWRLLIGRAQLEEVGKRVLDREGDTYWYDAQPPAFENQAQVMPGRGIHLRSTFATVESKGTTKQAIDNAVQVLRGVPPIYDTLGWAEPLGHYWAVQSDLRAPGALTSPTWNPFVEATRRLYLGVVLNLFDVVPMPQYPGPGDHTTLFGTTCHAVVHGMTQKFVGMIVWGVGLCPMPRFVNIDEDDTKHWVHAVDNHPQHEDAKRVLAWWLSSVGHDQSFTQILQHIVGPEHIAGPGQQNPPLDGAGRPLMLPFAPFPAAERGLLLPRLWHGDAVQLAEALATRQQHAFTTVTGSLEQRGSRYVLAALTPPLQAVPRLAGVPNDNPSLPSLVNDYTY